MNNKFWIKIVLSLLIFISTVGLICMNDIEPEVEVTENIVINYML